MTRELGPNQTKLQYERPWMYDKQERAIFNDARYAVVEAPQPYDAVVYTPVGPRKMGDLEVGDRVFGSSGQVEYVEEVHEQGVLDVYEIETRDGAIVEASGGHKWVLEHPVKGTRTTTTKQISGWSSNYRRQWKIPVIDGPVQFDKEPVPVDPWLVGFLLGDGSLNGNTLSFSTRDKWILDRVRKTIPEGYELKEHQEYGWYIRPEGGKRTTYENHFWRDIEDAGIRGFTTKDKFIPDQYRYNSVEVRKEVICGLIDSDGSVSKRGDIGLQQTSPKIAQDVREIIESLGGVCTTTRYEAREEGWKPYYVNRIRHPQPETLVSLPRKKVRVKNNVYFERNIKRVEKVSRKDCRCITTSSKDSIYLTDNYLQTHNSTKSGKTVGCIVWLFEQAMKGEPGFNYWWVAPVSTQADIAWRRMKQAVPDFLYETNETNKRMDLANGTSIWFKTGDEPDSLYGEDVYAAVIDEASRVKQESWHAVRSTLTATQAPVRIIGNVKGKKNWAYKLARRAEQKDREGDDRFSYEKITAYDAAEAGVLAWEEIEDAKATYPEDVFRELYLAEPAGDEGNPFGVSHIHNCIMRRDDGSVYHANSEFRLETDPVCWGWDIAKHTNWTVGIGLDKEGRVCRFQRFKDSYEATLYKVMSNTKNLTAVVDSTRGSGGDQILERLQREGGSNFKGYKFSTSSKQQLMLGLAVAIQNGDISYPDGRIVEELEAFEYEVKPSGNVVYCAPDGFHDDCVDALALANTHWQKRGQYTMDVSPVSFDRASPWKI